MKRISRVRDLGLKLDYLNVCMCSCETDPHPGTTNCTDPGCECVTMYAATGSGTDPGCECVTGFAGDLSRTEANVLRRELRRQLGRPN